MGVKDLWNILSPLADRKPLFELHGKAIAIDLSCWVVDSQTVTDNVAQPKMYLRNLFFRTSYLLMHEISPIFVLEGVAPTLKHKTIARRNEIRAGTQERKTARKGGRNNFNRILKECEEMLKFMGITCVRGYGEAEAMCAYLNAEGLVEGCISQDSDCFLYGAKIVYRNFCTSMQGNRGGYGGSIDEYTMEKIKQVFDIGRNKMIALALLCGCDYNEGLNGVGKEAALKLFKIVDDDNILERIKSWKSDSRFEKMEAELSNPNICTTCGHAGKARSHLKSGCQDCRTHTKCDDLYKEKRALISNEISIRKKALLAEDFPNQELIDEFLARKDPMPSSLDVQWKQPHVLKFVNFMERHVAWEAEYAYAKILPLLTRWQVRNLAGMSDVKRLTIPNLLIPEMIKKTRNIRSVASYEILWKDEHGLFDGLTLACPLDKECDGEDSLTSPTELATIEPQHFFKNCYPELVEDFENARLAKKKKPAKARARKAKSALDEPMEEKEKMRKAQRRPRKGKTVESISNKKMDDFIKYNANLTLEDSFERMTITPKRKKVHNDNPVDEINILVASGIKKLCPQFDRVKEVERMDNVLNGSLLRMFNELTPSDFASDLEDDADMSKTLGRICLPEKQTCLTRISNQIPVKENNSAATVLRDGPFVHNTPKNCINNQISAEENDSLAIALNHGSFVDNTPKARISNQIPAIENDSSVIVLNDGPFVYNNPKLRREEDLLANFTVSGESLFDTTIEDNSASNNNVLLENMSVNYEERCFESIQRPVLNHINEVDDHRKSNNCFESSSKLKAGDGNDSADEFAFLSSTYVPLSQRVNAFQSSMLCSSTPKAKSLLGKKFSFGLDDLFNQTSTLE